MDITLISSCLGAIFSLTNMGHALAGGIGNVCAIVMCYPLEIARTRLQVDDKMKAKYSLTVVRDIYREEGITGVYRGLVSLALSLFAGSFIYFLIFHGLKATLREAYYEQQFWTDLIFGLVAGMIGVLFTNPLWVINTRLKLQGARLKTNTYKDLRHPRYDGIIDCFARIIVDDGVWELWSGTKTSLMLVSNPAIQYMVYEGLKRFSRVYLQRLVLNDIYYFMFGAISKMVATVVTYPLQLMQTRVRAGFSGTAIFNSDSGAVNFAVIMSWYRGLESKLSQTMLTAAIMLLCYERITMIVMICLAWYNKDL